MSKRTSLCLQKFLRALAVVSCFFLAVSRLAAIEHDVSISVFQGHCADGDFDTNLATVRQAVRDALERGSDFLVMPETFLSGQDTHEHVLRGARQLDDPQLKAFIAESAAHNMVIMVGMSRITDEGIYNSVVIQQGRLLGTYSKIMLTGGDVKLGFLRGKDLPVFTANGVKFAVIICHDTSFPYPAMIAKLKGAEILFAPHYNNIEPQTVDAHRHWVKNCNRGIACQMKVVVARSNVVNTAVGLGYGDSLIVSPRGDILAEAALFKNEMITTKITPEMFKFPYVWGDLKDTPNFVKKMLANLLLESQ